MCIDSQGRAHGDAGLLCLQLFARLVLLAMDSPLSVAAIAEGYHRATTAVVQHFETASCQYRVPLRWNDVEQVLCLVQSILRAKTVIAASTAELRALAVVLTQAFLSSTVDAQEKVMLSCQLLRFT
jgi:hypothetical protein